VSLRQGKPVEGGPEIDVEMPDLPPQVEQDLGREPVEQARVGEDVRERAHLAHQHQERGHGHSRRDDDLREHHLVFPALMATSDEIEA
jgi:hypothetical protein